MTDTASALRPAAQYLRMSRDSQRYSLENQAVAIAAYAASEGFEIVQSYEDAGRSGVTTRGRLGLARLMADVVAGDANYQTLIVLDVSRWGRYQDPDEAAHYEFLCRSAGIDVRYCGEQFGDDLAGSLMKHIKRVMAGEYSRELSRKVRAAKSRLADKGYAQGGRCPYGLQRLEFDPNGRLLRVLPRGMRKGRPDSVVRFAPGSDDERRTVNVIFQRYVTGREGPATIAAGLNASKVTFHDGTPWTDDRVRRVLACRTLTGVWSYAKTWQAVGGRPVAIPEAAWRRVSICTPVVSPALFQTAERRRRDLDGSNGKTDAEMLVDLRLLLARHGYLSQSLIQATKNLAHVSTYYRRFGSLEAAYNAVGYSSPRPTKGRRADGEVQSREEIIKGLRRLACEHGFVTQAIVQNDPELASWYLIRKRFGSIKEAYVAAGIEQGRQGRSRPRLDRVDGG